MKIAYFRILGNDLIPRHTKGQTLANLNYQLEHEMEFDDVEKIWIVNRIVDPDYEAAIVAALGDRRKFVISVNPTVYKQQVTFEQKYHYLTNVNAARNLCLEQGFVEDNDIVLPFDGNCFFTTEGWYLFRNEVINNFNSPYFMVPMSRCQQYSCLKQQPQIKEMYTIGRVKMHNATEPQIGFGKDHDLRFNTDFKYSVASKVELLWKLGIPGIWDYWYADKHTQAMLNPSKYVSRVPVWAGYVHRLPSGNAQAETCNVVRGADRQKGLQHLVEQADSLLLA